MVTEVLTRCGYRCDLCHAYKDNIEKDDQRQMLSDGWFNLFGFRIVPENIYCEGCISSNCLTGNLIDKGCPVRPCVIEKGYENCAQCDKFICEKLKERIVIFEEREEKVGFKISRSERKHIIKPYENFVRLNELKEANALHSRMLNKLIIPTDATMKKFIESEDIVRSWDEIHNYINNVYVLNRNVAFGGKKYGWCIGYKKGKKTITTLFPERKGFTILFTFGRSEIDEYENRKAEVSAETRELIASTDQLHDGRWIWLKIRNESQIDDVKTLLEIKRKPIRRR